MNWKVPKKTLYKVSPGELPGNLIKLTLDLSKFPKRPRVKTERGKKSREMIDPMTIIMKT